MSIYAILGLVLFVILMAVILIRYVHLTVDREFQNLARAVADTEYRGGELARVNTLLAGYLPLPEQAKPIPGKAGFLGRLGPILLFVGIAMLWGGAFAHQDRRQWIVGGFVLCLLSALAMLVTLRRRKWERVARLLRFRADLLRLDGDHAAAAADLRQLLHLSPWDDAAWAELSDDLAANADLPAAMDAVRQAARLDPRYDEYRMLETSLALRLVDLPAARQALSLWAELAKSGEDDPRVRIYRAALELAEGRPDEAARSLSGVAAEVEELPDEFIANDQALAAVRKLLPSAVAVGEGGA